MVSSPESETSIGDEDEPALAVVGLVLTGEGDSEGGLPRLNLRLGAWLREAPSSSLSSSPEEMLTARATLVEVPPLFLELLTLVPLPLASRNLY